ncbi:MAG: ABC transporter substrate binding protein, partial [Burkholderiales bacterium]
GGSHEGGAAAPAGERFLNVARRRNHQMKRRRFLITALALASSRAFSQTRAGPVKIGMLSARPLADSFYASDVVRRLGELGYQDGKTMTLEFRAAGGTLTEYPKLARQLAEIKCDLVFAVGPEHAAQHFRDVAPRMPVVFLAVDYDPLEKGLVASLARPGGSITGVYIPQAELASKRIQIMREIVPAARKFVVFVDAFSSSQLPAVRSAAQVAGIDLMVFEMHKAPYDFEAAFAQASKANADAYVELASPIIASNARAVSALLQRYRIPGAAAGAGYVEIGILVSYGPDPAKVARRAADLGVRVLKGAKPGDIPVEEWNEFELVINSKTARALNIRIPESVRARATRIVQ